MLLRLRARRPRGNHDCFVQARGANGDVIEWDEHGMECAVCIDVATRSRQMYASGASVRGHPRGHREGVQADAERYADAASAALSRTPACATTQPLNLAGSSGQLRIIAPWNRRAAAFARLFEAVHEGVYIGTIGPDASVDDRRQPSSQADLRLRRARRPKPTSARSIATASSIRRRASRCSSGCRPTAPSPTTCCACAAPTTAPSGSR